MELYQTDVLVVLAIALMTLWIFQRNKKHSHFPYPPGPKRLPLLGNLHQFPSSSEWITYDKWCRELGTDILYLRALGNEFLILNSLEAIDDLCEKRSSIYSSRPTLTMLNDLMGWDWLFALMPYGEPWKERRRRFTKHFHPMNVSSYQPKAVKAVREMLPSLLETPENFRKISGHAVGSFALDMAYGFPLQRADDPYIDLAERAVATINEAALPGRFLVNVLPVLKHLPEYVPGGGFHKTAKRWRQLQEDLRNVPFDKTVQEMAKGIATASYMTAALGEWNEMGESASEEKEVIKDVAGMVFEATADTTLSSIASFFAAMLCYPDVQKKAQEELDRVLGGRLPEFNDEKDLPYITAIIKETLRWHPIAPLALPHASSEDNVYRGYFIPKGIYVMANSWALLQDERHFPDPTVFRPERFLKDGKLNPNVRDPTSIIFGYGRRVCPGSHIALGFLWLSAASILSTFNITPDIDQDGMPIEPNIEFHPGIVCDPKPFKCTIKPRSKSATMVVTSIDREA